MILILIRLFDFKFRYIKQSLYESKNRFRHDKGRERERERTYLK